MSNLRPWAVMTIVPMRVNRNEAWRAGTENTVSPAASFILNVPPESMPTMTGTVLAPLIMLFRQYSKDFIGLAEPVEFISIPTA
jgi:hypothetical protein